MNITQKQRKIVWVCLFALAALYYVPSLIMSVRRLTFAQRQEAYRQSQQQAAQKAALAKAHAQAIVNADPTSGAAASGTFGVDGSKLLGVWEGAAMVPPSRGFCNLHLELRAGTQAAPFTGFATLACSPAMTEMIDPKSKTSIMQNMMLGRGLNPLAVTLAGTAESGSLKFKVEKVVGAETAVGHCVPTAYTITPFGTNTVTAEFQDSCGGGQMLLRKR